MEINVQKSTILRPAQETPKQRLPNSDLDLVAPSNYNPLVFFYRRPNYSSPNFFDAGLLKEALKKILVPFHPVAGRLPSDESGRTNILCNGEGVLFVEAETSCIIDDFGDFAEGSKLLPLLPTFDDTKDNSSYPLMMTQVTRFKCGGVCLATRFHHILADGASTYHFVNSWAEMTRGVPISIPPFFDRTVLDFGVPNSPRFHHTEYDPPPLMNTPTQNSESICTAILNLSLEQINILKEKSKENRGSTFEYTRLEVLAAHIWRCVCKAQGVVFLEAETSCAIDDLGDFESSVKLMNLAPPVDSNEDISSYPLILVQVTHFLCAPYVGRWNFNTSFLDLVGFLVVAAHVWRCVCKARGLPVDQATKLHIPTNGRSKLLNPTIPLGYIGNVSFSSAPMALSGDIQSEPLNHAIERIHKAVKQMDDKYLNSSLAYLKQQPDLKALRREAHTYGCPNLLISKLIDMPVNGASFGWGGAVFSRTINDIWDGEVYILPGPAADGSLLVIIALQEVILRHFSSMLERKM
ncbi:Shikimate O-hydroxycinnamoyltransferase [Citrus sinensis]|nr:Shikimate O-hydroxycinnamoyltransferase [Citrus sinensis]